MNVLFGMISWMVCTTYIISTIRMYFTVNQKFTNQNELLFWHDQLGHSRSIMIQKKKVENLMWTPT